MTILVENGSGVAGAESYFDADWFETFCESWGLSLSDSLDEDDLEAAMRRGTLLFDSVYGVRFPGTPVSSSQGLMFPMTGLVDRRSFELPPLPVQVQQAAAVLVWQEVTSPMSLYPTVTGRLKKSVTVDKVSVEYEASNGQGYVESARPTLSMVEGILSTIVVTQSAGQRSYVGSAERG